MQNLTLNIAQYQTFNVQYCKSLLYSHLNDNKLKILIQYPYLLVSYAFDENNIKYGIFKSCLFIDKSIFRHHFGWVRGDQSDWDSDNGDTYPWDFKTQSSLNIYLNLLNRDLTTRELDFGMRMSKGNCNNWILVDWKIKDTILFSFILNLEFLDWIYVKCPVCSHNFPISIFECFANLTLIASTRGRDDSSSTSQEFNNTKQSLPGPFQISSDV